MSKQIVQIYLGKKTKGGEPVEAWGDTFHLPSFIDQLRKVFPLERYRLVTTTED